ncbi:hypothetical protein HZH68_017126 [Vespula germanica]|uniref:Fatty acyl-CoA reductase n=1 Tax=Vespula germanica TaxID=30212 RepID=A0A834IYI6_VESGE|nr:hypothetical protein HZH68_017126 [Vespula germanica]
MQKVIFPELFATLREEQPKFQNRIVPIEGDCSFQNLGISKTDRNTLIREVSIVFNVATTIFVHVSTAFANCTHDLIDEKFYDPNLDAEHMIDLMNSLNEKECGKEADSMPIGIFRPAIVTSTCKEPIPGWIDNTYEPIGITAGVLMGLMRTHYCDRTVKANLVPTDLTVNGLIVSAWHIANNRSPIIYSEFVEVILKYGELIPSEKAI